jgi:hypothetical protein
MQIWPCKDSHVDSTEIIACHERKNCLEVEFNVSEKTSERYGFYMEKRT